MRLTRFSERMRAVIGHDKLWSTVSAVASAIAAVAALLAIHQARQASIESRLATRPYFLLTDLRMEGQPPRLSFKGKNLGTRPAVDLDVLLLAIASSLKEPPTLTEAYSTGNDVEPGGDLRLETIPPLRVGSPVGPQFVVIAFAYRDTALVTRFTQVRVMLWAGEGKDPELTHVDRSTRDRVINHLRERLKGFV